MAQLEKPNFAHNCNRNTQYGMSLDVCVCFGENVGMKRYTHDENERNGTNKK